MVEREASLGWPCGKPNRLPGHDALPVRQRNVCDGANGPGLRVGVGGLWAVGAGVNTGVGQASVGAGELLSHEGLQPGPGDCSGSFILKKVEHKIVKKISKMLHFS